MFRFQSIHAVDDHGFANAKSSVIFSDTYMVQTASSSVMAAEDAAHYDSILPDIINKTEAKGDYSNMKQIQGGVTAAKGFEAAGVEAAIKYQNRRIWH